MAEAAAEQIHRFVQRALRHEELADDEDIFGSGLVNSLFAMELVTFLEGTFGFEVESEDLELDNFRTVDRMAALVARKTGAAA
jgi:acyl carrier protein